MTLDVITPLVTTASLPRGLRLSLRRLLDHADARAGALAFGPRGADPVVVTATRQPMPAALTGWLRAQAEGRMTGARRSPDVVPGTTQRALFTALLGSPKRPVGAVALLGGGARRAAPPAGLLRQLGAALEGVWQLRGRTLEAQRYQGELEALGQTSRLITGRMEQTAVVLESICRSVGPLIGASGCGIGLLGEDRHIVHAAMHGGRTEDWRALELRLDEWIAEHHVESGRTLPVGDVRGDVRPGARSMLCLPLMVAGLLVGTITAFASRAAFTAGDQQILERFAEQASLAIHNARLSEERMRLARETRALLEAGRAVSASLDVQQTMRVIMEEARSVLGVESCGVMTLDPTTRELTLAASLDLPQEMVTRIRVRVGEGITGMAVSQQRPVQSADLYLDPRGRYPDLARASGLRSMLAVPLLIGAQTIGAITVLRRDMHYFSPGEEELLVALADQAAIALEHARLYQQLEAMVAERTRELDEQKRFVEVVLETLPLGVFVLDAELAVVRANREGERALGSSAARGPLSSLVPTAQLEAIASFLRAALASRRINRTEEEMVVAGESKTFRLTAAPIEPSADHLALLIEDVTLAKRLERQMLLTERLTTAGRLAAGVAHELNNPLATIAGCAEALQARSGEGELAGRSEMDDFRHYLGLIEEEAYRCKDITSSLLQFVREPGSRRAPADLNGLVLKTVELLSRQSRFKDRSFVTELDPALPAVPVNEGQLRQVFLGIAANALEAMSSDGTLQIRTRHHRDEIELDFEDSGPGIPDEIVSRIFDPFFTTKPPGQGTGLGLAIAQGIVTDHGGRIEVTSRVGKGSIFRVVLPI